MIVGRESCSRKGFNLVNNLFFLLMCFSCLYPIWYIIIQSLSTGSLAVNAAIVPIGFSFSNYTQVLNSGDVVRAIGVSVARTVIGTGCTLVACMLLGYLFSKQEMPFRKFLYRMLIITMYVSGGLIPTYLVYKAYGLNNNFLVYILPYVVNAYYVILIKTYIEQLPAAVEESAMIDGAGTLRIFFSIVFPMSLPIAATIAIYAAVAQWNAWFDNHIYAINNLDIRTLQYTLYRYLQDAEKIASEIRERNPNAKQMITPRGVRMAVTVISVVPILFVYPFLQRFLIKGIVIGAVKG